MDYDTWKTTPPRDYYTNSYEQTCPECREIQQKFDHCNEFLQLLVDQIYGRRKFDRELVEMALDELCGNLDVQIPNTDIKIHSIKAKDNKIFDFTLDLSKKLIEPKFITMYS